MLEDNDSVNDILGPYTNDSVSAFSIDLSIGLAQLP